MVVTPPANPSDKRLKLLNDWLAGLPNLKPYTISVASADASFRRYFRIHTNTNAYIAMDAPPEQEDCQPFDQITTLLESQGLNVPHVHARNLAKGFLLLDDLGTHPYLTVLDEVTAPHLYRDALIALHRIQQTPADTLPKYDHTALLKEMNLFETWFLEVHLGIELNPDQRDRLEQVKQHLIANALDQPQVFVHRDYHARNLMLATRNNPGILDYQDAVRGPITYDLVSLLRDCYIRWPPNMVTHWALTYLEQFTGANATSAIATTQWLKWFDLMGMQRHLKAIGIFARLYHRDGKPGYLPDIPTTLGYLREVSSNYQVTAALAELIDELDLSARIAA